MFPYLIPDLMILSPAATLVCDIIGQFLIDHSPSGAAYSFSCHYHPTLPWQEGRMEAYIWFSQIHKILQGLRAG